MLKETFSEFSILQKNHYRFAEMLLEMGCFGILVHTFKSFRFLRQWLGNFSLLFGSNSKYFGFISKKKKFQDFARQTSFMSCITVGLN